jgi:hypothetical protein
MYLDTTAMKPCEILSAADVLAIPPDQPERLFSGDPGAMRGEFIALVKRWHPDRSAGSATAALVFDRVTTLHRAAQCKLAEGRWAAPDSIRIEIAAGGSFLLPVKRRHAFELGEMAIASDRVVFLVDDEHAALFEAGLRRIAGIRYPDASVRRDIAPFMPEIEGVHTAGDRRVAIIAKPDDVVLLADLLRHAGGALPPRHVAWIVSSLLNLVCFFAVGGLTHNALAADTVFVTPQHHAVYPLGGWWYAARTGARLAALPEATYGLLPPAMAASKRADIRLDLESVRAIGRTCLGDPTGLSLHARADLPRPMADFLRLPSSGSAIDDYRDWGATLDDSFGPRRFVELPISFSDVYP